MVGRWTLNPSILVRLQVPQQATEGERSAQRQQAAGTKATEGERSAQRQQAAGTNCLNFVSDGQHR